MSKQKAGELRPIWQLTKDVKEALGLNQADLARALGVNKGYVNDMENSQRYTSRAFAARLLALLEVYQFSGIAEIRKHLKEHILLVK